jgi:hypothetical protein
MDDLTAYVETLGKNARRAAGRLATLTGATKTDALRRMRESPVLLRQTHKPSPFAFPIMVSRFREKLTSEKLADRVKRMQLEYDKATGVAPEGTQLDLLE